MDQDSITRMRRQYLNKENILKKVKALHVLHFFSPYRSFLVIGEGLLEDRISFEALRKMPTVFFSRFAIMQNSTTCMYP